ncbi:MAG: hypothetical protein ABEI06_02770 [Halobacteriaceae archaeon]
MKKSAILAFGVLILTAGCISPANTTGSKIPSYESYVFDHGGTGSPIIEGGITYNFDSNYTQKFYVTTVTSPSEVSRFNMSALPTQARQFINQTDFSSAYLIVIQAFPESSVPNYRIESLMKKNGKVTVHINDSSTISTADITIETILIRVHDSPPTNVRVVTEENVSFQMTDDHYTVTRQTTSTPDEITLPFSDPDPAKNVADPRDITLHNLANDTVGYQLTITYMQESDCRNTTPPCGKPDTKIMIFSKMSKIPANQSITFEDIIAKKGTYTVTVRVFYPEGDTQKQIKKQFTWTITNHTGNLTVHLQKKHINISTTNS